MRFFGRALCVLGRGEHFLGPHLQEERMWLAKQRTAWLAKQRGINPTGLNMSFEQQNSRQGKVLLLFLTAKLRLKQLKKRENSFTFSFFILPAHKMNCVFSLAILERKLFLIPLMMHLPMTRRKTSPTPSGQTSRFLFRGISLHALCASRDFSDTYSVARRIAILATVFPMFAENSFKQVINRIQLFASKPNSPWLPCVFYASFLTADEPMFSKIAACNGIDSNVFLSKM